MNIVEIILLALTIISPSSYALGYSSQWETFKSLHNRTYKTLKEERERRLVFEDNVAIIEKHNQEAKLGIHSFTLGVNQFADLTNDEFRKIILTWSLTDGPSTSKVPTFDVGVKDPDSVDWRSHGAVTPVKNQGHCGSCWSFSATGAMEGAYFRSSGELKTFSEQDLMDCGWGTAGVACAGGNPYAALQFVLKRGGACLESEYPYEGVQGICRYDDNPLWNPKQHILPIKDVGKVAKGNEAQLKSAVARYGPVSVGIDAGHRSFQLYNGGVYRDTECSDIYLNHAVLAVGYSSANGDDYWIVKNSWGETWGDNGYVKMARNDGNMCGIATDPTWAQ